MSDEEGRQVASFESAMRELEEIVRKLETGETDLESAIAAYERGVVLKKLCEDKLREAELRVEKIEKGADGTLKAEPFEAD